MEIIRKHFETIDSTNNWCKSNCHLLDPNTLTLVTAASQTKGRGRLKKEWVSPLNENIYATFCFDFDSKRKDLGNIPQVLALSTVAILKKLHFSPQLKWPNDILLSNKKVSGILCETVSLENHFMVILGIGLNINMPLKTLQKIDKPATSLKEEAGQEFEIEAILNLLQEQFQKDLELFLKKGFGLFLEEYKKIAWTNEGKKIRFHDNLKIIEGFFHSINDEGALNLIVEGHIKTFISGEFLIN
ncbi:MAG TPA: biotin--[acetyl-CoA-carboxylase] ligase [Parachlamydiaceae bacterium]|nr:biotin--[acetyl-CoA-carboxylase] ligase [Parachlamydiaceae bacterium]